MPTVTIKPYTLGGALSRMRPYEMYTCAVCKRTFIARDKRAKFCSNRCRQADKYKRVKAAMKELETKVKAAKKVFLSKTATDEQKDEALHFLSTVLDEDEFCQIAVKGGLNNFR